MQQLTGKLDEERRQLNVKKTELKQLSFDFCFHSSDSVSREIEAEKRRVSDREQNEKIEREMTRREEEVARMESGLQQREAEVDEFRKDLQIQYAIRTFLGVRNSGVFLGSAD